MLLEELPCLKDLWFVMKSILNIFSVNPKYALLGLQFVHVIHLLSFWQLSLTGLSTLILNLQSYCYLVLFMVTFLLCPLIIFVIFSIQL